MPRSIVIVGTLDTKGDHFAYMKQLIEKRGHRAIVMDVGVLGDIPFKPTISREQVAEASGSSLRELLDCRENEPKSVMDQMAKGASRLVKEFYRKGELDGLVSGGGSMGTALALEVIKVLPLGVPKLIVSTIAYSTAITPDMLSGDDLMMVPLVAGLWGLNSMSKRSLQMAAGAISGAAETYDDNRITKMKTIGVTSVGGSAQGYMNPLKHGLEERGYEVAVFHGTGMSGRIFEKAIMDGFIAASLDLVVGGELMNYLAGGVCSAGEHRLEASGEMGIPQIVSPGRLLFHWWSGVPLPDQYGNRVRSFHNSIFGPVSCSSDEAAAVGTLMAEKLNKAKGPTAAVIPTKPPPKALAVGVIKQAEWDAFREAFAGDINSGVKVVMLDGSSDDPSYVDTLLAIFDEMMPRQAIA
ncbi:MAG: Tm-1-like ATP-binding domain-containing protein [Deltaproteobacteria bacterium]|nr:Tm-1-like ATP-binding domain-containing protein [Deltaproteobacteria bacterium]